MKFTEEAQTIVKGAMENDGANALKIEIMETPQGRGIAMDFIKHTDMADLRNIDGINVLADAETAQMLEAIIFTGENGQLGIQQESCGCGCGCGGEDHGEGSCCGGEGHDHEHGEGCCCGGEGHDHEHGEGGCCGH